MRGGDIYQGAMFSYLSPEERVPQYHPLRPIRRMADQALREMSPLFEGMYQRTGRLSIAPEKLLRSLLLQVLYSVRSERMLVEQLQYNLLFRWFVGLSMDDPVWNHSTYSKNRDRLLDSEVADVFFRRILEQAGAAGLLSDEHFSVDGTLLEAWASLRSFQPRDKNTDDDPGDFKGQKRSNETHRSTTDPDSRLFRKSSGDACRLAYMGHVLMENRNALVVGGLATQASGTAEREAAVKLVDAVPGRHKITVGADKGYDTKDFVKKLRGLAATPHVARKKKGTAIDGRTTRHVGYAMSINARKGIEKVFGWCKQVGPLKKLKQRGVERVNQVLTLTLAGYNLVRMRNLGLGAPT